MLIAKGEREPDFYIIDPNARGGPNLPLDFPVLARNGIDMAYKLRETGELEQSEITNRVFEYLAKHCCCVHMNKRYVPEKKPSDSTGVVGVRI